ncbi:MAG: NAD-dependent epimerase/dehydratase family protein [Ktedonobacterales bacterium]|nr:NAD-dependent epimerase/dehydratase family protein [Ktedonobacterales bacterium]
MHILIIGGTVFLGRHIVRAAQARGHDLTIFHRGQHPMDLPDGVHELLGDRNGDLAALVSGQWDVIIDTSAYVPRQVRAMTEAIAARVKQYVLISTISVYGDDLPPEATEATPVETIADPTIEEVTGETYGPLKALCETAAETGMPGQTLIIRPGLIVGPNDPSDRFTYWLHRVTQGGEILAPASSDYVTQFIDVRDLADWTVRMAEAEATGVYHATGPIQPLPLGTLLAECQVASGSDARFTWVDEAFLAEHAVGAYVEMPLWVPSDAQGFNRVDCAKAIAAGLSFRPLAETVRDTLAWDRTRPASTILRAGLAPEREAALLADWHAKHG